MVVDFTIASLTALLIAFAGTRLTRLADVLADRTGLGEAFMGAVFLGACTSLPGITASVTAAWDGFPTLSLSHAFGGIAAQTAFLGIADLFHRRANLEHAAASLGNLMMGALLIVLLGLLTAAMLGPDVSLLGIHPVTPMLLASYGFGMRILFHGTRSPMWTPRITDATRLDEPESRKPGELPVPHLWLRFSLHAIVVVLAGWFLTRSVEGLSVSLHIGESVAGALGMAIVTSLPELVTSIAAVRRGALTLAVGGILGGNAFDTLFAAAADCAYLSGSIYHAVSPAESFLLALTITMTGVLLLGLLRRQERGPANIGFESLAVLVLYGLGVAALVLGV